jgi:hypothetical protein
MMRDVGRIVKDAIARARTEHLVPTYSANCGVVKVELMKGGDVDVIHSVRWLEHWVESLASDDILDGKEAVRDQRDITLVGYGKELWTERLHRDE